MPKPTGALVGYNATLHRMLESPSGSSAGYTAAFQKLNSLKSGSSTNTITSTEATALGLSGSGTTRDANKIPKVMELGNLSKERTAIAVPEYGTDAVGTIPGQIQNVTFDFKLTLDFENDVHTSIVKDDGKKPYTWVVRWEQESKSVFSVFQAYISTATTEQAIDNVVTLTATLAVTSDNFTLFSIGA